MTVLTIVTIVASFAALTAGALAWRWKRQDRDRSAARVAALAATLDGAHDAGAP